ncbi:peptidoglycan-binding protein [Streptomyces sp. NPDC058293]|uniref:peptidoglycan-binding protein n=1 Tax=Streptomyces sp. NPDC058293 TaxID=3346429 RepID=UPI0036ED0706
MHHRLVAEGCDRYRSSSNIAVWGAGDARSYTAWQKKLGCSGGAANGTPRKASWDRLRVPTSDGSLQGPAADLVRCSVCGARPVGARWNWRASRRKKTSRGVPVYGAQREA